jgi:HSP90 family molecular chaperone
MINDNSNLNKTGLTSSVSSTKSFSIANNGNIFDILSNKIYERPIEAIVREVYSNAIDANIAAKSTGGIKVTLPSSGNPVLIIEDNGITSTENDKKLAAERKTKLNDFLKPYGI